MNTLKSDGEKPLIFYPMRLAIIEANPWESNAEAWRRHLLHCPQDSQANVKIFNRGMPNGGQN